MPAYFVVVGSGRPDGNTALAARGVFGHGSSEFVLLTTEEFRPFNYEAPARNDTFLKLIERLVEDEAILVLASPVYWSGVSAQAKAFVDRFADLLTARRDLGQRLHGKAFVLLLTGSRDQPPPSIEEAMNDFSTHLAMRFCGSWYVQCVETSFPPDFDSNAEAIYSEIARAVTAINGDSTQ